MTSENENYHLLQPLPSCTAVNQRNDLILFSLLHNEASRGIASKGASKTKNAKQVDYRGLVATATSGLDTINISGSREQKNHIYRYFRIDYHIQLSLIYL